MQTPPKLFHRFLRWYCDPGLLERIEGDLIEVYLDRIETQGKRKADMRFAIDVLLLFRPAIIKSFSSQSHTYSNAGMIKNYFTVAWRNLF